MSISDTESHPAFYHSKKRIWDFPITLPASNSNRPTRQTKLNAYCVCGFDSLWKLWYAVFVVLSTCLLFWLAIVRYQEFKAQSFHPRFGFDWNWSFPLNLQVACLVAVVCLFPLLIYASVSRVGHSANDGIVLGRDCLHLHAMLAQLPCFRLAQRSADPEAAERLRARIAHSTQSLNEATQSPDFESFIIQDRVEALEHASWYVATRRQLRPFACLIHVLIAFALLLPVCVFEAEQIKNEAIPPEYVWHSNLDWLLNGFRGSLDIYPCLNFSSVSLDKIHFLPGFASNYKRRESSKQFNGHPYPSIPADLGPEFVLLAVTLVLLTVRFASPFWFTSRSFSTLLSLYTAMTGCYILLEAAAIELLSKICTAGTRDSYGNRVDVIPNNLRLMETWICIITSAVGFLSLLAGLMAFYSFGELLFQRSVANYATLIMAGELDSTKPRDIILREGKGSTLIEDGVVEGNDLFGPSVIAVTTKVWRPTCKGPSVTGNTSSRAATPSALSASSDTLRSKTASTLGIQPKLTGKSSSSVAFWPSLTSALAFGCLAITRSCLFGPMLQCYWHAQVKLPLIYVIFSILYLILWLVLWFGVTVKTAWRFRLLHMPAPSSSRYRFTSPKHLSHAERLGLGVSQFAPWPLMNNPAAAQLGASYFWPWLQYQNGFAHPQNGSLAFGSSPTPYDGNYADRGPPEVNPMYGCFTDAQQPSPGGLLRDGPPTLSDGSDNVIQIEYDRPSNYAYLQKGAGLVTICDGDGASEESYQPYRRNTADPAYVSLASLGRTGSPQRSSQGGSRRGALGARVTFKSDDEGGVVEGNNASSDSGVCTNGSGSRIVGKLNLNSHPLFVGDAGATDDRASSPHGFMGQAAASTAHSSVRLETDERLCSQV
ncbi:hypothetical protein ECG_01378 [Echinococcus granulosus]|uniref:Lipase_3 domain-containing protein n=2 Tax=Echinococcus granulosus TaxID=6210 RepID=A0A068W893_ECHGR|nr:hypothetical protein ECG_01378 [Echinococcus granulosus]CDS15707.1 hypothetical protein EgrG_000811700 [Echinococcus granulosus]